MSSNDLTLLATDRGPVPMHMAAVLEFGADAPEFAEVSAALAGRIPRVPRLRQRLTPAPWGCGRPLWADDPSFSLDRHLEAAVIDGGRDAVLRFAADLACRRLPTDRPPWAARWVRSASGGPAALVFVAHHAMADGLGGLAVLAALADQRPEHSAAHDGGPSPQAVGSPEPPTSQPPAFPQPPPSGLTLLADAWRERAAELAGLPRALKGAARGLRELAIARGLRIRAAQTSFNRPTGGTRRVTEVTVPLRPLLDRAHALGCTLNDLILVAVCGAIASALRARGESPGPLVVSVPITSRRGTGADGGAARLGNQNGVVPVEVPSDPDPEVRLARVAAQTAARAGAPRGTSAGPLGVVFRALARAGIFQRFIDRQRLVNTFLSNMRGPAEPLSLAGHRIAGIVPFTMTPGNVGVCFTVLSYAGSLVVAVVADPEIVPEQDELTRLLVEELDRLTA
ncbi:wax ester/triacylglycerol synthase domain-containing protein [Sinomonas cyclohexanicum]|uniref:wax ester/triacylglycerol synthase domain-containing protein n=1 Tax=Sinomonas cyclohexanicum TaxID=322009 RepID=UPI001E4DA88F|nr:wax ester/triacylglycerol synthase domain-containing protein [Corynebacterium cyclohexanicum]